MILAVSGWRDWQDMSFVFNRLALQVLLFDVGQIHLRVGCCPTGVDRFTRTWATAHPSALASFTVYNAKWDTLGKKAAGPIRNRQMLRGEGNDQDPNSYALAEKLLAFPEPGVKMRSPGSGTVGCLIEANLLGIDVEIPGYKARQ